MKTVTRRYDIDWLRVIAIGLLLIYHIAIIFQPWAMFIAFIRSDELSEGLWKPMTMLNVWRIPILFYVSGMGLFFAMRKRNWSQLLTERTKRILVPFLFGIVVITPLHMFVFQKYYKLALDYYPHFGHLWFLGNIFCYVVLLLPIFLYFKKRPEGTFKKWLTKLFRNPIGLLLINVFFVAEVTLLQPKPFAMYAETWHGFFLGLLAFFFGFLFIYAGKTFWQNVVKWRWLYVGIAAVLFTIRFVVFAAEGPGYLTVIESNCWIFAVFGFCHRYLNKPCKTLSYLSKAAYPVYIIHMIVLYLAAMFILPYQLPALVAFVIITVITFVGCFIMYEFLIRRIAILRPFFGLNWNFKNTPKATTIQTVKE
ncbi:MAG: acyltransferase family protein [Bacteroidota bacterium]